MLVSLRWDVHGRVYLAEEYRDTFVSKPTPEPSSFLYIFDSRQNALMSTSIGEPLSH